MDVEKVLCSESFLVFGQFMMVSCKNHPLQHFSTFHRQVFSAKYIIGSVAYNFDWYLYLEIWILILIDISDKVIHPKLYNKDAYALAYTIECIWFSLFWSQRVNFIAKIVGAITFSTNQLFKLVIYSWKTYPQK